MIYKFYDTCSLLLRGQHLFDEENTKIVISSITLQELENIKNSRNKDENVKFSARNILNILNKNVDKYEIHIYQPKMLDKFIQFEESNDIKILATAFDYDYYVHPDETVFITNDLALKAIANLYFGEDSIQSVIEEELDQYTGYKEIIVDNNQLSQLYENLNYNWFNLYINEYIIVKNQENKIIDRLCWTGETHRRLKFKDFTSQWFGTVRPIPGDTYQMFAADSLANNQVSMLCGKPGSGKTYLAFGYLFHLLEKHEIDRIIIFCNPVVAKDAARLGFYPGTRYEKLMGSQVGAVLSSKLGDEQAVERLVSEGKLILMPAGDARGYEVPKNSGVYIMESQNLTCDLLRMLLQRVSEGCRVIVDGDYNEQVDMNVYAGSNNGMRKMSKAFRGQDIYGQVELKNIHRSKLAALADNI